MAAVELIDKRKLFERVPLAGTLHLTLESANHGDVSQLVDPWFWTEIRAKTETEFMEKNAPNAVIMTLPLIGEFVRFIELTI